jgi:hypothetical protein
MNDVDLILHEAGERWRALQPPAPSVDAGAFDEPRRGGWRSWLAAPVVFAATAASVAIVLVLAFGRLGAGSSSGGGPGASPASSAPIAAASPSPSAGASSSAVPSSSAGACALTRPEPPFVAPPPAPASPPAYYQSAWYGSAKLWTMLNVNGEVWRDLPSHPNGLGQKTFWWSVDWEVQHELEPRITVTGRQLDGPGTFRSGPPGTNASADFGTAMLVGVLVPSPGCWEITGAYGGETLSFVVSVEDRGSN